MFVEVFCLRDRQSDAVRLQINVDLCVPCKSHLSSISVSGKSLKIVCSGSIFFQTHFFTWPTFSPSHFSYSLKVHEDIKIYNWEFPGILRYRDDFFLVAGPVFFPVPIFPIPAPVLFPGPIFSGTGTIQKGAKIPGPGIPGTGMSHSGARCVQDVCKMCAQYV